MEDKSLWEQAKAETPALTDPNSAVYRLMVRLSERLNRREQKIAKLERALSIAVDEAYERYEQEVEASNLSESSKFTYISHAHQFVRWLQGDFEPGGTLR